MLRGVEKDDGELILTWKATGSWCSCGGQARKAGLGNALLSLWMSHQRNRWT